MSERQVRDEVMTLLLAGHETTALALSWAFLLLDRNPGARDHLEAELAAVLGDGPASPDDVPALPYTQAVINETLRLYPPAYVTGREAIRATTIGRTRIPKRHIVLISMYTTHRDPRFFPEPDAFRPERWLDGLEKRLPRGAFIPFGMGSRKCVGASFAMMEATLLLATIARRWRFELAPGDRDTPVDHAPAGGGHARTHAASRLTACRRAAQRSTSAGRIRNGLPSRATTARKWRSSRVSRSCVWCRAASTRSDASAMPRPRSR